MKTRPAVLARLTGTHDETLFTPADAAALFRVCAKTITRWAKDGKLPAVRTPGGHRRYRAADLRVLLED